MTPQPQQPKEEFYWLTKSQLDTLLLDLEYHRYNLARRTEEAIRSQKYAPHTSAGAQQQRIEQVIKELEKRIEQSKDEVAQAYMQDTIALLQAEVPK